MPEGHANIEIGQNSAAPAEETVRYLGRMTYVGTYLTGDRLISRGPYVDGEGENRDYYVDVLGPSQTGKLEISQISFEAALRALRFKQ